MQNKLHAGYSIDVMVIEARVIAHTNISRISSSKGKSAEFRLWPKACAFICVYVCVSVCVLLSKVSLAQFVSYIAKIKKNNI